MIEGVKNKRHLNSGEIEALKKNNNFSDDPSWQNIYVSDVFKPEYVYGNEFHGRVILGNLSGASLKFHDLELITGIYNSLISCCRFEDEVCVRNVHYLANYCVGSQSILFNIQEMSCTKHSKFGSGIIKEGEPEENRIWVEAANENGGRSILPFETILPADAYIWSRHRDDETLMQRFIELTEAGHSKKNNTYGTVGEKAVIKNTSLIKDVKIGSYAYIKGALKLKNISILSSKEEPSQIGEGVEMVNGIMGYGSKVFYQAVAVRFVLGRNCQLKYGARLLNSVLGDNSTVSCCELLNNIIFPFHEQHHNTSFLIAATVQGQSNIAAGSTIGSNHNSRSSDGEIFACRGFWPGLSSDFKHNSYFASFTLVSKGSYSNELNIRYPFSLVSIDSTEQALHIMPAYWFLYNMYALTRNGAKFKKRDKRLVKEQIIETEPLAPDTIAEILIALDRIITLSARYLKNAGKLSDKIKNQYQAAKDFLHQNPTADFILEDERSMKRFGAKILKPVQGYKEYRKAAKYFALKSLLEGGTKTQHGLSDEFIDGVKKRELFTEWQNIGGQIIPSVRVERLLKSIKEGSIKTWDEVHQFYRSCAFEYGADKERYALYVLEQLYSRPIEEFTPEIFADILHDVLAVSNSMYENSVSSRQKDYTDFFRTITYRSEAEMNAVTGNFADNDFLKQLKKDTDSFNKKVQSFIGKR